MSSAGENQEEDVHEVEEYEDYGEDDGTGGEPDDMEAKLAELDEESKKINELQKQIESHVVANLDKEELDSRSVYIGNVSSWKPHWLLLIP